MEYTHVVHTFEPIYDARSEILILGSFPSVKSRENAFYYGHPQNRFWKVTAGIFGDVIASCDIAGSSDASIKNVIANDMNRILAHANIRRIGVNGATAYRLFLKYCMRDGMPKVCRLPSTSPANAAWNVERLKEAWKESLGL